MGTLLAFSVRLSNSSVTDSVRMFTSDTESHMGSQTHPVSVNTSGSGE